MQGQQKHKSIPAAAALLISPIGHEAPQTVMPICLRHFSVLFGIMTDHGETYGSRTIPDAKSLYKFAFAQGIICLRQADCVRGCEVLLILCGSMVWQRLEVLFVCLHQMKPLVLKSIVCAIHPYSIYLDLIGPPLRHRYPPASYSLFPKLLDHQDTFPLILMIQISQFSIQLIRSLICLFHMKRDC